MISIEQAIKRCNETTIPITVVVVDKPEIQQQTDQIYRVIETYYLNNNSQFYSYKILTVDKTELLKNLRLTAIVVSLFFMISIPLFSPKHIYTKWGKTLDILSILSFPTIYEISRRILCRVYIIPSNSKAPHMRLSH